MQHDTNNGKPTGKVVFDIGGSLFRSGVYTADGRLVGVGDQAATSHRSAPHKAARELRRDLVDYLLGETARLRQTFDMQHLPVASISLGAALDANTGMVLGSGPLWGNDSSPFDPLEETRARMPDISWHLVNDITAALLRHAADRRFRTPRRMALVTVSSGIGCRTYDFRSRSVPVDREFGVQGEIGHIPISFTFEGQRFDLRCDCGGLNHLNAFCSGHGIAAVLREIAKHQAADFTASRLSAACRGQPEALLAPNLTKAVVERDAFAMKVLDAITQPLAAMLVHLFTLDPEIECLVLTGGVIQGMGTDYLESVLRNLDALGLYQVTTRDPSFFRRRVRLGICDGHSGLIGAAVAASLKP